MDRFAEVLATSATALIRRSVTNLSAVEQRLDDGWTTAGRRLDDGWTTVDQRSHGHTIVVGWSEVGNRCPCQ
jgi:hypothetical protein